MKGSGEGTHIDKLDFMPVRIKHKGDPRAGKSRGLYSYARALRHNMIELRVDIPAAQTRWAVTIADNNLAISLKNHGVAAGAAISIPPQLAPIFLSRLFRIGYTINSKFC